VVSLSTLNKKWDRLIPVLKPLRDQERPPSEYGVRLMALEALERREMEWAMVLAEAATVLHPDLVSRVAEAGTLKRAVEYAWEYLKRPEIPRRPPLSYIEIQNKMRAGVMAVFIGARQQGILARSLDYYTSFLSVYRERDLRLMRVYIKAGVRAYGELNKSGQLVLPPLFYQGLEDLLVVWAYAAFTYGKRLLSAEDKQEDKHAV